MNLTKNDLLRSPEIIQHQNAVRADLSNDIDKYIQSGGTIQKLPPATFKSSPPDMRGLDRESWALAQDKK